MRGNTIRVLFTALTVLVLGAGTASAVPVSSYVGYGGPVGWFGCAASTIGGPVDAGLLGDVTTFGYQGCQPTGLPLSVAPQLPWQMTASSPSAYTVDDIEIRFVGPACAGTIGGYVTASYDSVSGDLTVVGHATVVTHVDPANDCFGLVQVGDYVPVLSDSYDVVIT